MVVCAHVCVCTELEVHVLQVSRYPAMGAPQLARGRTGFRSRCKGRSHSPQVTGKMVKTRCHGVY